MKRFAFISMLLVALCTNMLAQEADTAAPEEQPKGWIYGELDMASMDAKLPYAICNSNEVIEGRTGKLAAAIWVVKMPNGTFKILVKSSTEPFAVDQNQLQSVLIQFDDNKASNYPLSGSNNDRESAGLNFNDVYKNRFQKGMAKAQVCKMKITFVESGEQELTFNVGDLKDEFKK